MNENVIPFLHRNISKIKTKQFINPQKEISGGFLFLLYKFKIINDKDMKKMSGII